MWGIIKLSMYIGKCIRKEKEKKGTGKNMKL